MTLVIIGYVVLVLLGLHCLRIKLRLAKVQGYDIIGTLCVVGWAVLVTDSATTSQVLHVLAVLITGCCVFILLCSNIAWAELGLNAHIRDTIYGAYLLVVAAILLTVPDMIDWKGITLFAVIGSCIALTYARRQPRQTQLSRKSTIHPLHTEDEL